MSLRLHIFAHIASAASSARCGLLILMSRHMAWSVQVCVSITTENSAKTAEPIEMQFGALSCVGQRKHEGGTHKGVMIRAWRRCGLLLPLLHCKNIRIFTDISWRDFHILRVYHILSVYVCIR